MHVSIGMNEYLVNSSFRNLITILWGYLVYLPKNLYTHISVVLLLSLNKNFWINTSQFIFFPVKTEIQTIKNETQEYSISFHGTIIVMLMWRKNPWEILYYFLNNRFQKKLVFREKIVFLGKLLPNNDHVFQLDIQKCASLPLLYTTFKCIHISPFHMIIVQNVSLLFVHFILDLPGSFIFFKWVQFHFFFPSFVSLFLTWKQRYLFVTSYKVHNHATTIMLFSVQHFFLHVPY